MDRQQPVKISLESALQNTRHNETLELMMAFKYSDNKYTIQDEIKHLMPFILHKVPKNPNRGCFNCTKMVHVTKVKHLKSFVKRFIRAGQESEYLILWPNNQLPYGGDHIACNRIAGTSIIKCFIESMHHYTEQKSICASIQYMFLITGTQRNLRLCLHHGNFNKFGNLFRKGSVLVDEPSDTDSEYGFSRQSS